MEPDEQKQNAETLPAVPVIDSQITTARAYPRDVVRVIEQSRAIVSLDLETAEQCWYALPRDGKLIEGPSIRLAEVIASEWGNIQTATRLVRVEEKRVVVEGACWDLEKNMRSVEEVSRGIWSARNNRRYGETMIETTIAAARKIALRNAIFSVVPRVVAKKVLEAAQEKLEKEIGSVPEAWRIAVAFFSSQGVQEGELLRILGCDTRDDVRAKNIVQARGLATALRDGLIRREDLGDRKKRAQAMAGAKDLTDLMNKDAKKQGSEQQEQNDDDSGEGYDDA